MDDIEVFNNEVLVGLYTRGDEKTSERLAGGVIMPPIDVTKEDDFQTKSGYILKMGPVAFVDKGGEKIGSRVRT